MSPSEDLHQLIHSLSQGEKWNFKIHSSRHTKGDEKNYLRLFKAIDKQEVYDEAALIRRFKNEPFAAYFSVIKSQLYTRILESLDVYHARETEGQKIKTLIRQMEIVYQKGLYTQANKLHQKAWKLAEHHNMPLHSAELLRWSEVLLNVTTPFDEQEKQLEHIRKQRQKTLENLRLETDYQQLSRKLVIRLKKYGFPRHSSQLRKFDFLNEHPLMRNAKKARTPAAKYYYYLLKCYHFRIHDKVDKAYEYYRKSINLMEQYPDKVADNRTSFLERYATHVGNFLSYSVTINRFDDYFENKLEDMLHLPKELSGGMAIPNSIQYQLFVNYYSTQLRRAILTADFELGTPLVPKVKSWLKKSPPLPNYFIHEPWLSTGMFCFCSGDYGEALWWISHILNDSRATAMSNMYGWLKIISIMIHFELGNEAVLEYSIKSTYRYLLKKSRLHSSEKLVMEFFKKYMPYIHDEASAREAFITLHSKLLKLADADYETSQYDLVSWLESRIQNKPISAVMQQKAQMLNKKK